MQKLWHFLTARGGVRRGWQLRSVLTWLLAAALLWPLLQVAFSLASPQTQVLAHAWQTTLPGHLLNTASLVLGVCSLALILGVSTAWAVTHYEFIGRQFFEVALLLPLAVPAFFSASVYDALLNPAGLLALWLRELADESVWLPSPSSLSGASVLLALALYPYVYFTAREAFLSQPRAMGESARLLGAGSFQVFMRVALPAARPAIMLGVALVGMEAVADFGTVYLLGVDTLSTSIFRLWTGMYNPAAATQIAVLVLVLVGGVLWLERHYRTRFMPMQQSYGDTRRRIVRSPLRQAAWAALCALPVVCGFVVPVCYLVWAALSVPQAWIAAATVNAAQHSLTLGVAAAMLVVPLAFWFAYAQRVFASVWLSSAIRMAASGYMIPGFVIAAGIFAALMPIDRALAHWISGLTGQEPRLWITGTVAAIIFACVVRFLAVALNTISAAMAHIPREMDDAVQLLGGGTIKPLLRVHLPLLWPAMMVAGLLVFVDVIKELPATLMLRPFNYDTLAVRAFQLAKDDRLMESAPAALMVIGVSSLIIVCVSLIYHGGRTRRAACANRGGEVLA